MKNIHKLKIWFERLSLRERALFVALVWAISYALFSFIVLSPVSKQQAAYAKQVKEKNEQIKALDLQIDAVKKIANSPLYAEWKKQHEAYQKMRLEYKSLITGATPESWHKVLKTVLENNHPDMTLLHIENSEEKLITSDISIGNSIYQQDLILVIEGNYFSTIKYLENVEELLPNVHWVSLKYEVTNYPTAKTTMEFSVFYDKEIE